MENLEALEDFIASATPQELADKLREVCQAVRVCQAAVAAVSFPVAPLVSASSW